MSGAAGPRRRRASGPRSLRPPRPADPRERLERSLLAVTADWLARPAVRPILAAHHAETRAALWPLAEWGEVSTFHAIARLLDLAGVEDDGEWPNPFADAPAVALAWGSAARVELGRILAAVLAELAAAGVPVDTRGELNAPALVTLARLLYWPPDWSLPAHELAALYAVGAVGAVDRATGAPVLGSRHLTADDERDLASVARTYRAGELGLPPFPRPYARGARPRTVPEPARVRKSREERAQLRTGMVAARAEAEACDLRLSGPGLVRLLGRQARERQDDIALHGHHKARPVLDAFLAASGWAGDLPSSRRLSAALRDTSGD